MTTFFGVLAGFLILATGGVAQDAQQGIPESYIPMLRSNISAKKTEIITQNLTLTSEQANKFWPLQREYENDLSKLGDKRGSVIHDFKTHWDNLTDTMAKDLGNRLLDYQKDRVALRRKYFDRMSKELSPVIAAKFFQIELQLEHAVDLAIASEVPLVK